MATNADTPTELEEKKKREEQLAVLRNIELPDPDDKDAERKWKGLARALLPIYRDAAAGALLLDPTQRQILQSIMDRAYGKVGQKKDADQTVGVVVLPTQGDSSKTRVCEDCLGFHLGGHR